MDRAGGIDDPRQQLAIGDEILDDRRVETRRRRRDLSRGGTFGREQTRELAILLAQRPQMRVQRFSALDGDRFARRIAGGLRVTCGRCSEILLRLPDRLERGAVAGLSSDLPLREQIGEGARASQE